MFNNWEPTIHDHYEFGSPLLSFGKRFRTWRGYNDSYPISENNYPGDQESHVDYSWEDYKSDHPDQNWEELYPKDDVNEEWSTQRFHTGDWSKTVWDNAKSNNHKYTEDEFKDKFPGSTTADYNNYTEIYDGRTAHNQKADEAGLTSTYWADLQKFMESQPGYEAYSQFIPEHLQRINELEQGQMDPYTGQLTVQDPWQREAMLGRLGQDFFGGHDEKYDEFGGMFRSTKEALLPQMDKNFKEQVSDPMAERLEMLGLSGASPGMEMTAGVGQDFAIDKAMAGAQADNVFAGQMMGVEQARQGAMGATGQSMVGLMGMGEATQRANIGTEYQDWMAHQQDPYTRLGMGGQAMNTSAGALSSAAGQSIQAAEIPYAQGSAWDMMTAENNFMAPFYTEMAKPVSSGGGKK